MVPAFDGDDNPVTIGGLCKGLGVGTDRTMEEPASRNRIQGAVKLIKMWFVTSKFTPTSLLALRNGNKVALFDMQIDFAATCLRG